MEKGEKMNLEEEPTVCEALCWACFIFRAQFTKKDVEFHQVPGYLRVSSAGLLKGALLAF